MVVASRGWRRCATLLLLSLTGTAMGTDRYSATPLPFRPFDINSAGQIVGVGPEPDSSVDYGWLHEGGVTTRLEPFAGHQSGGWISLVRISDDGRHIVGQAVGAPHDGPGSVFESRAVRYMDQLADDLGSLPGSRNWQGARWAMAQDVNDDGVAVGSSTDASTASRPVVFRDGQVIEIDPGQNRVGSATQIGNDGAVLGNWLSQGGAAYHRNGGTVPLPPLEGHSHAIFSAMSAGGLAAGISRLSPRFGDPEEIVTWNTRSFPLQATPRGAFPGALAHLVGGITDAGVMAGWAATNGNAGTAFLLDDAGFHRLDDLITETEPPAASVRVTAVHGINGDRWIIGHGEINGEKTGLLLRPIPDRPRARLELGTDGSVSVSIRTEQGISYRLESTVSLNAGFPTLVGEKAGDGSTWTVVIDPRDADMRFYRLATVSGQ